jgi:hypothetical protein
MLKGTAARVLFGDPSLIVTDAFSAASFEITVSPKDQATLHVNAVLKNGDLKSTYTDTYYADLAKDKRQFNDCARLVFDLPEGWNAAKAVMIMNVTANGKTLEHRLVGFGVEKEGTARRLHVQVDVPSTEYMQSALRRVGARVELDVLK